MIQRLVYGTGISKLKQNLLLEALEIIEKTARKVGL